MIRFILQADNSVAIVATEVRADWTTGSSVTEERVVGQIALQVDDSNAFWPFDTKHVQLSLISGGKPLSEEDITNLGTALWQCDLQPFVPEWLRPKTALPEPAAKLTPKPTTSEED
jgi:uncharacterized membrane protein